MPIIVPALIIIFLLIVLAFIIALNAETNERNSVFGGLEMVLFLVMMPKHSPKKEADEQKEEKIMIAQMEQVFSNFLYLKKPGLFQSPPCIAFEIASQIGGSDISFYLAVPKYLETVFEKYVQGVYPSAVVDKVPQDYTIFEPQGAAAAAYLRLSENFLFPISTYQTLERDPLSLVTNDLSKISANEGGAVQVVIRPLSALNLRKKGEKALKKIREGRDLRTSAIQALHGPVMEMIETLLYSPKNQNKNQQQSDQFGAPRQQGFDQKGYDAIQSKIQKQPFEVNIRIAASAQTQARAEEILSHLTGAFSQYSLSAINSLEPTHVRGRELKKLVYDFSFMNFNPKHSSILNLEELASIYHFPSHFIETPYIKAAKSVSAAPPSELPSEGASLIGKVMFRGEEKKVYLSDRPDRGGNFYIIGQKGGGK